jgi:hypothetical protein
MHSVHLRRIIPLSSTKRNNDQAFTQHRSQKPTIDIVVRSSPLFTHQIGAEDYADYRAGAGPRTGGVSVIHSCDVRQVVDYLLQWRWSLNSRVTAAERATTGPLLNIRNCRNRRSRYYCRAHSCYSCVGQQVRHYVRIYCHWIISNYSLSYPVHVLSPSCTIPTAVPNFFPKPIHSSPLVAAAAASVPK